MSSLVRLFGWGFGISMLGTLPLGTLNVAAMQVSVTQGLLQGIWFSLGVALVEIAYVRVSLVAIHWIQKHSRLLRWMDWVALAIVLALAVSSFAAAMQPGQNKNMLLQNDIPHFLLGLIMSAVNPLQIPFWFGWSTILFTKKILRANGTYYNCYTAGIGLGTLAGLAVFVWGGHLLVNTLNARQQVIHTVIGCVFLLTAAIQLVKIIRRKKLAESDAAVSTAGGLAGKE